MQGTPEDIAIDDIIQAMQQVDRVSNVHHVHIWQLDEQRNALEAHVITDDGQWEPIKAVLKDILMKQFFIAHSTLESEEIPCGEKY